MCISTQAAMQCRPTNELLFEIQIVVCSNNLRVILSREEEERKDFIGENIPTP